MYPDIVGIYILHLPRKEVAASYRYMDLCVWH